MIRPSKLGQDSIENNNYKHREGYISESVSVSRNGFVMWFEFQRDVTLGLNFMDCYQVAYSPVLLHLETAKITGRRLFLRSAHTSSIFHAQFPPSRKLVRPLSKREAHKRQEDCRDFPLISPGLEKVHSFSVGGDG